MHPVYFLQLSLKTHFRYFTFGKIQFYRQCSSIQSLPTALTCPQHSPAHYTHLSTALTCHCTHLPTAHTCHCTHLPTTLTCPLHTPAHCTHLPLHSPATALTCPLHTPVHCTHLPTALTCHCTHLPTELRAITPTPKKSQTLLPTSTTMSGRPTSHSYRHCRTTAPSVSKARTQNKGFVVWLW